MTLLVKTYESDPTAGGHVDNELGLRFAEQQFQISTLVTASGSDNRRGTKKSIEALIEGVG